MLRTKFKQEAKRSFPQSKIDKNVSGCRLELKDSGKMFVLSDPIGVVVCFERHGHDHLELDCGGRNSESSNLT